MDNLFTAIEYLTFKLVTAILLLINFYVISTNSIEFVYQYWKRLDQTNVIPPFFLMLDFITIFCSFIVLMFILAFNSVLDKRFLKQ